MLSPYKGSNVHLVHRVKSEIHSEVSILLYFPQKQLLDLTLCICQLFSRIMDAVINNVLEISDNIKTKSICKQTSTMNLQNVQLKSFCKALEKHMLCAASLCSSLKTLFPCNHELQEKESNHYYLSLLFFSLRKKIHNQLMRKGPMDSIHLITLKVLACIQSLE